MLTELATIKGRLGIADTDIQYDDLLTNAIEAISARLDRECNRRLARTSGALEEFHGDAIEIVPACYPIESVTKFELKTNERDGWVEQTGVEYLLRRGCVVSLAQRLGDGRQQGRISYTGGYVLPGTTAEAGQSALPADIEQAAVEQVASWFLNRDKVGLIRDWQKGGIYEEFVQGDLLRAPRAVVEKYRRW
jgi:hypothetical protein